MANDDDDADDDADDDIVMMMTMTALNTWAKSQTSMKEGTNASENVTEVERPSLELEINILNIIIININNIINIIIIIIIIIIIKGEANAIVRLRIEIKLIVILR